VDIVLPDAEGCLTSAPQRRGNLFVAGRGSGYLRSPVLKVRFGRGVAAGTAVAKAAVEKHDDARFSKDQVWAATKRYAPSM
jgi:hypothetical protein